MTRGIIAIMFASSFAIEAAAQTVSQTAGEWNSHWGGGPGDENRAFNPGTRDVNGNRVVINGRITTAAEASSLSWMMGGQSSPSGVGSASAIGNQLNVITQGDFNTVIIDSTQINNGSVTAIANGQVADNNDTDILNGEIDLDD